MRNFIENIDSGTVGRTIFLIIALANQIFAIFGIQSMSIDEDTVYQLCSAAATVIAAGTSWWKNNNFTQVARMAQRFKEDIEADGIE